MAHNHTEAGLRFSAPLTNREREVATLVARGHSNRQIGEKLVIATSTAERHVANILAKLSVGSRAEIAAWAVEHRLTELSQSAPREQIGWSATDTPQRNTNLPAALNSFVGREREITNVRLQLGITRLLTLTGSGGPGKTRLALQVAGQLLSDFDGVWLIELAALSQASLVPQALASAVGVQEDAGRPLLDTLLAARCSGVEEHVAHTRQLRARDWGLRLASGRLASLLSLRANTSHEP